MSGHGHIDGSNKRIALLIAILAFFLALAETFAKGAQTDAIGRNVEASNLWAFFQAKTVRQTAVRTAVESAELERARITDATQVAAIDKRIDGWNRTVARWESEPETNEGRKELVVRAKASEDKRDTALAKYHHFEIGSAAFQIAIVLASAAVVTGTMILAWGAGALGLVGIGFLGIGLWAPHAVHLL